METKAPILVVEDEEAIRNGLCDILTYHGYVPSAVESGEEGLRCALDGHYALVLLDVMLPGVSGFDVCRAVRAQRWRRRVRGADRLSDRVTRRQE